jgi:N-acetylgalactosamine-6-sulfatase
MLLSVALRLDFCHAQRSESSRPNVVFILADDLGWGDLGCYGHPRIRTPHLDGLAAEGVIFTQFYVNGSVCSPSRAAFMTGCYPARHSIHGALGSDKKNRNMGMPNSLDPSVETLPKILRRAGYKTAHFGKWHLSGGPSGPLPSEYGFDEFVSVAHVKDYQTREVRYEFNSQGKGWEPVPADFVPGSSELIVSWARDFIGRHRKGPFYVQLWLHDVHARLSPTPQQLSAYPDFRGALQIYYAAVTNMDRQIGTLLAVLDAFGIGVNTMIIFASDNGPEDVAVRGAAEHAAGSAGPFRGRKRSLYEGGIRVPLIVCWRGGTCPNQVDDTTVISGVDLLPSICRLANVRLPDDILLDGEALLAALRGTPMQRETPLMWEYRFRVAGAPINHSPTLAIREGKWKLLMNPDRSRTELYDLGRSSLEVDNVADQYPDVAERLAGHLLRWHATLPPSPDHTGVGTVAYPWPRATLPSK